MLIDGIKIAENSAVENLIVAKGDVFPAASQGELFYKTGEGQGLYVYNGTEWVTAGSGVSGDVYTKAETDSRIQAVVGAAPAALDTLQEIAAQLANDQDAVAALTTVVSQKADTSSLATVATTGSYNDLLFKPAPGLTITQVPYDIASSVIGKPANGDTIASIVAVRAFTVASGLAGSYAKAGTAATGSSVFTVYKNGASIGTFTFGANGTVASFAGAGASFAAGDVLTLIAPSTQDATLADIAWTLNGYLS